MKLSADRSLNDRQTERLDYIDGIRGIASMLVVFCHLACVFIPGLYFEQMANTRFEQIWINTPLNILTNGNAAVQCFFVLSGFLITRKVYRHREKSLVSPVKTYVKLLHVTIPAIIFAAVLMATGQMYHMQALEINPLLSFVSNYNHFDVSAMDVIKDIFVWTFVSGSKYIGPFWTIRYEFWGSVLTLVTSYSVLSAGKRRRGLLFIFGIIVLCAKAELFPFFVGALAFDCMYDTENDNTRSGKIVAFCMRRLLPVVMAAGLYLLCINMSVSGMWAPLAIIPESTLICRSVGCGLCVMCIHSSGLLRSVFSLKPLQLLGRMSAYIYAFHWPIILSLGCGIYIALKDIPYSCAVFVVSAAVIITTCLFSFGYTKALPHILNAEYRATAWVRSILVKNRK